jgi:hypothetical protein
MTWHPYQLNCLMFGQLSEMALVSGKAKVKKWLIQVWFLLSSRQGYKEMYLILSICAQNMNVIRH